jgi:pilus assembly protein CpaD
MTDRRTISFGMAAAAALLAPPLAAGSPAPAPANKGVDSIHQPVVDGDRAYVPGCPDWSSGSSSSAAKTDTNYGCAVNSNMAAMIAYPADLLHGRPYTGSETDVAARAIKAWRELPPTGSKGLEKVSTREAAQGGGQ